MLPVATLCLLVASDDLSPLPPFDLSNPPKAVADALYWSRVDLGKQQDYAALATDLRTRP